MLQLRHYITWPEYYFNGNCQFLWSVFPSELATVQPCTTSWIHKVTVKWTNRPCTDSLTPAKHWLQLSTDFSDFSRVWAGGKWLNLNYLIGSGNYSLWIKLLLPKLGEELATTLNAISVHISVSYCNLQWKIHKIVAHWVRPSLVHSWFPITNRINF